MTAAWSAAVGSVLADVRSPAVTLHQLLTAWQHDWLSVLGIVVEALVLALYVLATRRLAARGRHWSSWRTTSFAAGMVLVLVALQSGLASYDDSVFLIHTVQHLLLMNFAPILLVLGAPMTLALQSSSRPTQERLLRLLHHPVVEVITHPAVVVTLAYATMIMYFLTPLYRLSLEHDWLHVLFHFHFLASGFLFWWLVVGLDPSRWRLSHGQRLAALAAGIPVTAIIGVTLTGAHASVAPAFHTVGDTHAGGSVLWVAGELTTLVALGIAAYQWMRYEERQAARADRRLQEEEEAATKGQLTTQ
jgi:putative copper resistance protein D